MRKLKALPFLKRWTMRMDYENSVVMVDLNFNFLIQHLSVACQLLALCLQDLKNVFREETSSAFFIPLKFFECLLHLHLWQSSERIHVMYCDLISMISGAEPLT